MTDLKDRQARDKIAGELHTSFFVEAGAGSGKTYHLVERMVNLITSGTASIEHMAAVTFTRKAAAELSERFQIGLESRLRDKDVPAGEAENIGKALSNLEQVYIGTIHSFCARILRKRPVEAGIDPGFEEIEEDMDAVYAEMAWAGYIEKAKLDQDETLSFIEDMGIQPSALKESFMDMVNYPDVEVVTQEIKEPDLSGVKESIKEAVEFLYGVLPEDQPEKGWDGLQTVVRKAHWLIATGCLDDEARFIELLSSMDKNVNITQNRWDDKDGAKGYLARYEKLQEEAIRPAIKKWQQYMHRPLAHFITGGVDYYRRWRRERSILNFSDLLTRTAALLRQDPKIRQYFKKRYTHILVDEFQDTDPIQAEIILFLTGRDPGQKDWRKMVPAPGRLFVVGDPKQSIYRFRRADIDIYNQVKDIFSSGAGEVLSLYSNFRSLPFMRDTVDGVFKSVLPEEESRYQARYFPLETVKEAADGCRQGIMENLVDPIKGNRTADVAASDAARISNWIRQAVGGGIILQDDKGSPVKPQYSDFLILTMLKKNLKLYARSLEVLGIPYDISGGEDFSQTQELLELYRLFKAVDDDRDPVALITALRGMFFGVSDLQLYNFKQAGGRFSYYSDVPEGFDGIENAYGMLKGFREIIREYEPVAAVGKIIEELGILPLAVCREEGLTRAGNIIKSLELLRERKNGGIDTFSVLVEDMGELIDKGGIESMSLMPSGEGSVRIMNLHKAKGLEAPVVILADPLVAGTDRDPTHHITRTSGERAKGYFVISIPSGSYSSTVLGLPPAWETVMEEEKRYGEAEAKRLEYVAVTRAKNILVISTYREGSRRKSWEFLYDYVQSKCNIEVSSELDPSQREVFEVSVGEWEEVKRGLEKDVEGVCEESYSVTSVTTEAKEGYLFEEARGQGMGWGRIVHKAVELVCKREYEDLEVLGRKWIGQEEMGEEDFKRLKAMVDGFMGSDLYKTIEGAEEKYFEVPFAIQENGDMVYGVIDAVFKKDGNWVIVDYKTDDFEKDAARKRAYERQLEIYGKYWEKISGERVGERVLIKL